MRGEGREIRISLNNGVQRDGRVGDSMKNMTLQKIVDLAAKVFDEQNLEDLQSMQKHFDKSFNQAKAIATIAVGMVARIAGLDEGTSSRSVFDPIGKCVSRGVTLLEESGVDVELEDPDKGYVSELFEETLEAG